MLPIVSFLLLILNFKSFRSFHRISVLVTSSGPFQPRPTYMGLKQPFSHNLGFSYILVLKHSFPPLMIYTSLFVFLLHYNKVRSWKLTAITLNYLKLIQSIVRILWILANEFQSNTVTLKDIYWCCPVIIKPAIAFRI